MKRTAAFCAAAIGAALALPALAQETRIGDLSPSGAVTIKGKVTDVFGNKFVVEDGSGRVLVETGPHWHHQIDVRKGEEVTVTGRPEAGGSFDAFTLKQGDRAAIEIRRPDGPPPWAGRGRGERDARGQRGDIRGDAMDAKARAERMGYTDIRIGERKKRHFEATARDRGGERVELHLHDDGEVKVEAENEGPRGELREGDLDERAVRRIVEDAGYVFIGGIERKKKHVEVLAENRQRERVELHVDRNGEIYKEERRR
jgi:hypothetical protein